MSLTNGGELLKHMPSRGPGPPAEGEHGGDEGVIHLVPGVRGYCN